LRHYGSSCSDYRAAANEANIDVVEDDASSGSYKFAEVIRKGRYCQSCLGKGVVDLLLLFDDVDASRHGVDANSQSRAHNSVLHEKVRFSKIRVRTLFHSRIHLKHSIDEIVTIGDAVFPQA
jgi:hypothetical protein